jgi:hypothetical protein
MDRRRFVDTILLGFGEPRSLFWNSASPAREASKEVSLDLDKARSLLEQAGSTNRKLTS